MKKWMTVSLGAVLFGALAQNASAGWSVAVSGGFYAAPVASAVVVGAPLPDYVPPPRVCASVPVVVAPAPVVCAPRPIIVYSRPVYVTPVPVVHVRHGHGWHRPYHFPRRGYR